MTGNHSIDGDSDSKIAIIGMACRFPGADDVESYWENLFKGTESISFFSRSEAAARGVEPSRLDDPNYVPAAGVVDGIDLFDAGFFGYSPREAELTDPQHRLFLECAAIAIHRAGYDSSTHSGLIGVYGGVGINTYFLGHVLPNMSMAESDNAFGVTIANHGNFLTTQVSYRLNLKGPSLDVQTACSTSLVAVHLASQSLLNGECDLALAGGVRLMMPEEVGHIYQQNMISSPDGHCRAFDARAKGTVAGSGVGVVVLKRFSEAVADGDHIHAVILGSAINNDGADKVGYTAPSVTGQAAVISEALAVARVEAGTIGYVEMHGTGTALGDPIEVAALTQAFGGRSGHKGYCAIGSVKTNIGHADAAAGIAGFIKAVLALEHKQIPPSLHFERANPKIDLVNSPFYVNSRLQDWHSPTGPRRAGVSSFGIGGTNAHVILEEAPVREPSGESRPEQLLVISAKTNSDLEKSTIALTDKLRERSELNLADVAYTLSIGRKAYECRRAVVCKNPSDAVRGLSQLDATQVETGQVSEREPSVVFLFPGQGTQYVNMGRQLYQVEKVFRECVDRCAVALESDLGFDLRQVLYPTDGEARAAGALEQTDVAQPALFVIEYALAQLWMAWGVKPSAMLGHSIGEYVAACIAGVFSLEDGLALVTARGKMMQSLPGGTMLAVALSHEELRPRLTNEISVAAINGPNLCVVSGPTHALGELQRELSSLGVEWTPLHTSHAFHSSMMDPVLGRFADVVRKVRLQSPDIPYLSNITGTWITPEEATAPEYWAKHLRSTVLFARGLSEALAGPDRIVLEIGPGRTLSTLAKRHPGKRTASVILASLPHAKERLSDASAVLKALGSLWVSGVPLDWHAFFANERRHRVPLPGYPFERKRYWIDSGSALPRGTASKKSPEAASCLGRKEFSDWFYVPSWKRSSVPLPCNGKRAAGSCWLLFGDECGIASELARRLATDGQDVILAFAGGAFTGIHGGECCVNPGRAEDYVALLKELQASGKRPAHIVHSWGITTRKDLAGAQWSEKHALVQTAQERGFQSLVFLMQALGRADVLGRLRVVVVTNHMQEVLGGDGSCPEKATILGLCRVIPHEFPDVHCQSIDLAYSAVDARPEGAVVDRLFSELLATTTEHVIAFRGNHRWVQTFDQVRLGQPECGQPRGQRPDTRLRNGGVYLITGGLGGIGLTLAEHIATIVRAKIVLLNRSAFAPKETWDEYLASHASDDRLAQKIRVLKKLQELGSEVLIVRGDIAEPGQARSAVEEALRHYQVIDGVIHTAGVAGSGVIQLKRPGSASSVMAAKVWGTLLLEELLQDIAPEFVVLCSSLGSILGAFGQADYCGANAFLDAFACHKWPRGKPFTISINWDTWREVGMAVNAEMPSLMRERHASGMDEGLGLSAAEGKAVFEAVLNSSFPQVAVTTADLEQRIQMAHAPVSDLAQELLSSAPTAKRHDRPNLRTPYMAPRNQTESTIAEMWQESLGLERVGVHDDFFELGGDSLIAVVLTAKILRSFDIHLPLAKLFEGPTVEKLALVLAQARSSPWPTVVPIQPLGSRQPFFCIPGGGSNVVYFHALARHLGEARPFYGLQAKGLDGYSKPYDRMEDLAAHFIEAMQLVQPDDPYVLGGHSFGGAVALEMTRQLWKRGRRVSHLLIMDADAPLVTRSSTRSDQFEDAEWLMSILGLVERSLGLTLRASYDDLKSLSENEQLDYVAERLTRAKFLPTEGSSRLVHGLLQVWKANLRMDYVPQPSALPTRITLFRASEADTENTDIRLGPEVQTLPDLGWSLFSTEPARVITVPGDHITMLAEPHARVLAARVSESLSEGQPEHGSNGSAGQVVGYDKHADVLLDRSVINS